MADFELIALDTVTPELQAITSSDRGVVPGSLKVGKQINQSIGAAIASATALPALLDGNYAHVTGTDAITSIITTGTVGSIIWLEFDDVLVLTHHATNLILPGEADITTAAGDVAGLLEYGAGTYKCFIYAPLAGRAVIAPVDNATTVAVQTFTAAQRGGVTVLTSSGNSIAIDLDDTNNYSHTLTENTTLAAPSNPVAGQSGVLTLTQHASSPKTLAYNAFWKFAGGTIPDLTATNSAIDTFAYYIISATQATCQLIGDVK